MVGDKTELFHLAIAQAAKRLDDASRTSEESDRPMLYGIALGELLWWQVAFDELLGANQHAPASEEMRLGQGVRYARNALAHGDQPWDAARDGLVWPLRWPLSWGWKWRSLPEPRGARPNWLNQWTQYEELLVGADIGPTLASHRTLVLGMDEPGTTA